MSTVVLFLFHLTSRDISNARVNTDMHLRRQSEGICQYYCYIRPLIQSDILN